MMNEGNEFQTDGAAHWKARFASSVLVNGTVSSKVSDERVVSRGLTWWLRYAGKPVLWILLVVTASLYLILWRTGSQWSWRSGGFAWHCLGACRTILALLFCSHEIASYRLHRPGYMGRK